MPDIGLLSKINNLKQNIIYLSMDWDGRLVLSVWQGAEYGLLKTEILVLFGELFV